VYGGHPIAVHLMERRYAQRYNKLAQSRTSGGGDDGNRTHDLFIANEALCQLSYVPGDDRA
jgi:hypothetical protein